jgi:hypothetical protein
MKKVLFVLATLGLFACGNSVVVETMEQQSVGQIPCNAEHIEVIEHVEKNDGSATWMALCNGKTYQCERAAGTAENIENADVSCSEMESQMPE